MNIRSLVRPFKPWVIQGPTWKALVSESLPRNMILSQISSELNAAVAIAKPSENLYLGQAVGSLSGAAAALVNVAGHGEMAIQTIFPINHSDSTVMRLIDILPITVATDFEECDKVGKKGGKLLNHFGYRKQVMHLVPETLEDHAWIASALSYSMAFDPTSSMPDVMFDTKGGSIAGGVAGITSEGGIFRGSGIADREGHIVTPRESLEVSLTANGVTPDSLVELSECPDESDFVRHRFFARLVDLLRKAS